MLGKLAVKLVKARWGTILPAIFKAAAEGKFGPVVKRIYWFGNGYATFTGALFLALGTAAEALTTAYPDWAWCKPAAIWIFRIGEFLAAVGLLRGGVNSPWPSTPSGTAPFPSEEAGA